LLRLKSKDCLGQIRCSMLQHAVQHCTAHCNTLQHTATHCNTLQHTATRCNTLQHTEHSATHITVAVYFQWARPPSWQLPSVLVCVLSCVVVILQCVASCSALLPIHAASFLPAFIRVCLCVVVCRSVQQFVFMKLPCICILYAIHI